MGRKSNLFFALWLFWLAAVFVEARTGHGLIGYGIDMYKPACASACRSVIGMATLNCTTMHHDHSSEGGMMMMSMTSPECYATDDAFLQSLAFCISTRCSELSPATIETYWEKNVAGTEDVQPNPKESYQRALAKVTVTPTVTFDGKVLNSTQLVAAADYEANWNALTAFEQAEDTHSRYGLILLISGILLPVGCSLAHFSFASNRVVRKFVAGFLDQPAFGTRHRLSIFLGLGLAPTRGQALFIFYLIAINIILMSVGYESRQPSAWFGDVQGEIIAYVSNRAGVLSFANIPLLFLFSSRNSFLLWLTDWSRPTYVFLHKWIAFLATLEASLHSVLYLYQKFADHATESQLPYWYWGIIATLGMVVLLPTSILPLRERAYAWFLNWHIAISILVVAGCLLHIIYRFDNHWGYENWIYITIAVWGFDYLVRILRILRKGFVKNAIVTSIDDDYVKIEVPGVSASGYAYLYFPTLSWRIWEGHPFSIASNVSKISNGKVESDKIEEDHLIRKQVTETSLVEEQTESGSSREQENTEVKSTSKPTVGLTFYVRLMPGRTSRLRGKTTIPVLVEASYGSAGAGFLKDDLSEYPNLVVIAGGVGISAVTHLLHSHPGRVKLYWAVRSWSLVTASEDLIEGVDKEIFVGSEGARMDVTTVLECEILDASGAVVVVVCGPKGMADAVRAQVGKLAAKSHVAVKLVEESFSW
ncbi:ferric reductase-like protein transmembrane component 4 [Cladochytrium replicatum]|nr:ferric reductase-like protein transmembrane component 4 [Cladochytrium replicatum]